MYSIDARQLWSIVTTQTPLRHTKTLVSHTSFRVSAAILLIYITGKFLYGNYKQALAILDTRPAVLVAMQKIGAGDGSVVRTWLNEEEAYLRGLKREPPQETLEMEYYTLLVALEASS